MAKKETKETKTETKTAEGQALALTSEDIFRKFESVVPEGATTQHVLEAAMMIIGSSLAQMEATPRQRRDVLQLLIEYMLRRIGGFADEDDKAKQEQKPS